MTARGAALGVLVAVLAASGCTCSKKSATEEGEGGARTASSGPSGDGVGVVPVGLSAPIAATHLDNGDVIVAGLDVPHAAIRVQRIGASDVVTRDRTVLDGLKWSSESDLKLVAAGEGAALTWRGLRSGKLVRQVVMLGADLAPKGDAVDVAAASCATKDALWYTDGKHATSRTWSGQPTQSTLSKDGDVALACGAHRAFAVVDDEDGASVVELGAAGEAKDSRAVLRESDFRDDDQRERGEFTVGDDLGIVRLANSGSLALRELRAGVLGPLRRLKTTIGADDDVVATDASPRAIVVVYTQDASDICPKAGSVPVSATKVSALRVDRTTFEESTVVLSPGMCGREVGPFFTGLVGEGVSVAWVERVGVSGRARPPIAGVAHALVPPSGAPLAVTRIDQAADALADAGCDGKRCFAAALLRHDSGDAMVPGLARVLRYP